MESDFAPTLPILRPLSRLSASLFDGFSRRRSFQNLKKLRDDKATSTQFRESLGSMDVQQPTQSIYTSRPSSVYSRNLEAMSIQIYNDCQSRHTYEADSDTITLDRIQHICEAEASSSSDDSERNDNSDSPSTVSDVCDSYDTSIYTDITYNERENSPDKHRMSSPVASSHAAAFSPSLPMTSLDVWLRDDFISPVLPEIKPYESIMPSLKRVLDCYSTEDIPNGANSSHPASARCSMASHEVAGHRRESTVASTGWDRLFKEREAHKQIQPLRPRSHPREASSESVPKTANGALYTKWFECDTDEDNEDVDVTKESLVEQKTDGQTTPEGATRSARSSLFGIIPIALDSPMCSPPNTIINVPSPFPIHTQTPPVPCLPQDIEIVTPTLPQFTPKISFQENATYHEPVYYEPVSYHETQPSRSPPPVRPHSRTKQIGMKANQIRMEASKMKQKVFRISSAPPRGETSEEQLGNRSRHMTWMPALSNRESNPEGTLLSRILKRLSPKGTMVINNDRKRDNRPLYSDNNNSRPMMSEKREITEHVRPRPSSSGVIEEFQKRLQNRFPNLKSTSARDLSFRPPATDVHGMQRQSPPLRDTITSLPQEMSATWSLRVDPPPQSPLPCTPEAFCPSSMSPEFPARFSTSSSRQQMERPVLPPPVSISAKNGSQENFSLPSSSSGI